MLCGTTNRSGPVWFPDKAAFCSCNDDLQGSALDLQSRDTVCGSPGNPLQEMKLQETLCLRSFPKCFGVTTRGYVFWTPKNSHRKKMCLSVAFSGAPGLNSVTRYENYDQKSTPSSDSTGRLFRPSLRRGRNGSGFLLVLRRRGRAAPGIQPPGELRNCRSL